MWAMAALAGAGVGLVLGLLLREVKGPWRRRWWKIMLASRLRSNRKYYEMLTRLLKQEPDATIDAFINSLAVNSHTLETHLALGVLHRQRGELDRAVKVHENLLRQSTLREDHRVAIEYELALDYFNSGIYDRAESHFKNLADNILVKRELRQKALAKLVELYREVRDWRMAIDAADQLTTNKFLAQADVWRTKQAYFCCEVAEEGLSRKNDEEAATWLRKANHYDETCPRIAYLGIELALRSGDGLALLNHLQRLAMLNVSSLAAAVEQYGDAIKAALGQDQWGAALEDLYETAPNLILLEQKVKWAAEGQNLSLALTQCLASLKRMHGHFPYVELLSPAFLGVMQTDAIREFLKCLSQVLEDMLNKVHFYVCEACGFRTKKMLWHCPACNAWGKFQINHPTLVSVNNEV